MNFDQALAIAVKAHAGQTDKMGDPYIFHPLRIMFKMHSEPERIVAILHDVVEDSEITLEDLRRKGFSKKIIAAVDAMTKRPHEDYDDYVKRVSGNPLARVIKVADLEDNMELRLKHVLICTDKARMAKYQKAYRTLTGRLYSL